MAWKTISEADVSAYLSRREIEAFSRSADFGDDVLRSHIRATVAKARNYIACSGTVRLDRNTDTIPESIVSDCMAIIRYDLLLRYDITPNEARKAARDDALQTLQAIADGRMLVEPPDDEEPIAKAVSPTAAPPNPTHLLD